MSKCCGDKNIKLHLRIQVSHMRTSASEDIQLLWSVILDIVEPASSSFKLLT